MNSQTIFNHIVLFGLDSKTESNWQLIKESPWARFKTTSFLLRSFTAIRLIEKCQSTSHPLTMYDHIPKTVVLSWWLKNLRLKHQVYEWRVPRVFIQYFCPGLNEWQGYASRWNQQVRPALPIHLDRRLIPSILLVSDIPRKWLKHSVENVCGRRC